jgi:methylase of polypeptide subunit release factors
MEISSSRSPGLVRRGGCPTRPTSPTSVALPSVGARYEPARRPVRRAWTALAAYRRLLAGGRGGRSRARCLEIGATQAAEVAALAREAGYARSEVTRDLAGHERVLSAW